MSERHRRPYNNVLEMVGWTPLVRLRRVVDGSPTPLYGKCEFMNPGGSVKDRIGEAMISAAEAEGKLKPGGTIVEGTSGNTGLGLALAAAIKGYRCIFTMPDKMSSEKVKLLRAFGAEVIITPTAVPPDHPENYVMKAKAIAKETPGAVLANQFYNPANPAAHYRTTGPELWAQSDGGISHFVAGAGTGGTLTGTSRYLKEQNPEVRVVGVDPEGSMIAPFFHTGKEVEGAPYKVEGLGNDKIPGTLDLSTVDDYVTVSDGDAFRMARRLTREEGLFVGGSAGLIVHAAVELARELDDPDAFLVALLPDWGEHYLSKAYDDDWMRENGFLPRPQRRQIQEMLRSKEGDAGLISVSPGTPVRMALSTITAHDIGQLPVIQGGECVGSLGESSLMAAVIADPEILDAPVDTVMEAPYPVVEAHEDAEEVTRLLQRGNAACLVRDGGELTGIITRYDVVRALTGGVA
ncbi:MAG: pyridoxal-phosphate dependent enzyme [Gemmatimonadota bacterium]